MTRKKLGLKIVAIVAWLSTLSVFIPLYLIIVNSFKGRKEIFNTPFALPSSRSLEYYFKAMDKMNFMTAFTNSLTITVISNIFIVILAAMAAWKLVRANTKLSKFIFFLFIAMMLVPFQTIMIPLVQYMQVFKFGPFEMMNCRSGLIIMYIGFGASLSIFLYHGFIKGIPVDLESAASIDGCNDWRIFWRIVFPILKPITMTVIILNTVWIWNDYLLPSLVLKSTSLRTIPLSMFYFFGQFTIRWNLALAGLVLTIIPVIIFYLFAQKYIIKGITAGAIK